MRPKSYWRPFIDGAVTVYFLTAILTGFAMSRAMPALNLFGATYVGVLWPGSLFCAASRIPGCITTPTPGSLLANSLFTFR